MRDLNLPSQSWSADDTPDLTADTGDDNSQSRSLHYGA
jgi:hypothetical protein